MRISATLKSHTWRYRLDLEGDDRSDGRRTFVGIAVDPLRLTGNEYQVRVPPSAFEPHPDLHAFAIWMSLRPFLGSRLTLPFGVSTAFADTMQNRSGITFTAVDGSLMPRAMPTPGRPTLLFSGGLDSTASSMILPEETVMLFLDRIPYEEGRSPTDRSVVEMREARAMCHALQRQGRDVYMLHDDHEHLYEPYPLWHSDMGMLPALYLADTFDIGVIETGDVMCVHGFGGYHDGGVDRWAFKNFIDPGERQNRGSEDPESKKGFGDLSFLGLTRGGSTAGLTEVATSRIVHQGDFAGQTASCYFHADPDHPDTTWCRQCDKCFRKLLLNFIFEDREVPAELIDHFLSFSHLGQIFHRPLMDWHHCWFYIFQRLECRHPLIAGLCAQARRGPDLSMLGRWYSPAEVRIAEAYRPEVVERIGRYVDPMTDADLRALQILEVPPFEVSELPKTPGGGLQP